MVTCEYFQTWDKEAAAMAQRYAEDCRGLIHNSAAGRNTRRFGSCGENIFISTHKVIQYRYLVLHQTAQAPSPGRVK